MTLSLPVALDEARTCEGVNWPLHLGFHFVPASDLHKGDLLLYSVDEHGRPRIVRKVLGVCEHCGTVEVACSGLGFSPCFRLDQLVEVADTPVNGKAVAA